MARQAARLIAAALLAAFAAAAGAQGPADKLKTPQTPFYALSPEERRVLGPVQENWGALPGYQQQRLINSARRYPSLQPIQKERFDARIKDWATMTPEQRRAAREAFEGLRRLPPARQHELRERWLQQHRPAEASEPPMDRPQDTQRPPEERRQSQRVYDRTPRPAPGDPPAQRR